VLTAEARNAEDASEATLRIPNPPDRTGRLACSHCSSVNATLQILHIAERSKLSNVFKES